MVCFNFNVFVVGFFVNSIVAMPMPTPITLGKVEAPNERRVCKVLKDCHFYQQFDLKQIADSLRQAIRKDIDKQACGLNEYMEVEKVYCPVEDLDGIEHQLNFNETRISIASKSSSKNCEGSLKIFHAHESNLADKRNILLGGDRIEYPNLKKGFPDLEANVILSLEAYGCECWEVFQNSRFAGEKENVAPGEPHHLSIEMGSIRKIQCANDYDYYYNESEGE